MNFIKISLFTLISFLFIFVYGQELPPIQNFSPTTYKAENQNWAISQALDKHIYIANNKGLLEFNGADWNLYVTPNETITRSVLVINDRIYTGSYMEFGYWQKNKLGVLNYTSLSKKNKTDLIEDEEFWNIEYLENWVLFQSLNQIYIYNSKDNSINIINANNTITKIFKVDNSIYFQKLNEGLFRIDAGKENLISDDGIFKNNELVNIFGKDNNLLLLTKNKGFYKLNNDALSKWNINVDEKLSNVSLYSGIQLKNGYFALGTIAHGLIITNQQGDLLYQIEQHNGLQNNTVLSLYEDVEGNIWTGLDNGISFINLNSPYKIYSDYSDNVGSVYASVIYKNNLYLGTNQGLFYKAINKNEELKSIKGTEGQVWSLKIIDNTLFCGHNSGTFIIDGAKASKIPNTEGTWSVYQLNNKSLLLEGNYDGLSVLEKTADNWRLRNKIKGFNNSARYFEQIGNTVFVNHEYRGVFKLTVNQDYTEFTNVAIDTLIKGHDSGIIKYNDDLLYAFSKGVYKYDKTKNEFAIDSSLSKAYNPDEYISGKLTIDNENNLWLFTDSGIRYATASKLSNDLSVKNIPIAKEVRKSITGYENILSLDDSETSYLIGTSSGYIKINSKNVAVKDFDVFINSITNKSNESDAVLVDKNIKGEFENQYSTLQLSFYVPSFNKMQKTKYQYQLLGIYDEWSDWSQKSKVLFENLPYGDYTFNVRAKIGDKLSSNKAVYSFSIDKPWYISNLMLALYALGIILFSFFMHQMYKRYYSKQQLKLVEENKRKLQLSQVQNEKEIIRIKNQQLEKDIQSKSKELAASTMIVVKKNELLNEIKEQLLQIKDKKVNPVVDVINKSLNHNDNWELFKEAFNNADSEFLKNLKQKHPNLSPNDLKLCAYLRLNLSSKEIAPLFNISARSVEIKRYRLRKKMNLPHEKNLTDYILEI